MRPKPCSYCAIENGGYYFPELSKDLDPSLPYPLMAIVKKNLCSAVGASDIICDPSICQKMLEGAKDRATVGWMSKRIWQKYYQENFEGQTSLGDILKGWEP